MKDSPNQNETADTDWLTTGNVNYNSWYLKWCPLRNSSRSNISCEKKCLRYQMRIKTGMVLGIKTGDAKMAFVFEIDTFFVNYSWNDDKLSLWCQTRLIKSR